MWDPRTALTRAASRVETALPDALRRSYLRKFALGVLVLAVTVGVVQGAVAAYTQGEVREQANDKYETLAVQEATNLELWGDEKRRTVTLLSDRKAFVEGNASDAQREMDTIGPDLGPDVHALHYVDLEREEVLASTGGRAGTAHDDGDHEHPWFGAAMPRNRVYVSEVYAATSTPRGRVEEIQVVAFVARVPERPSRALVLTASVAEYANTFQGPGEAGFTMVVDGDREVVFDEFNQFVGETYPATDRGDLALRRAANGTRGTVESQPIPGVTSTPHVVGYAPVAGTDWVVLVHVPREQAYGYVASISAVGWTALAATLLLIGAVGAALGHRTASGIDRLRGKAERIERGEFDVTFETDRIDNLGRLYESFAHMRDALETRIAEVESARREAERRQRHLEIKAEEYREVMQACASGEFSRRMDPDGRNQAMSSIAHEFNRMMGEIERTNERLDEFASIVAHDLRNPLGLAQGYLDMARTSGDADHFDELEDALDRMETLIDDLLALARGGDQSVDRETFDLGTVARRAWRNVETADMTLETATAGATVAVDESRLLELFENLYRNAREHAGEDVTVRVEPLDDGEGFAVEDTGPGIPPGEREEVFDYGYTTSTSGTGLGLNIVAQVVDAHGWSVRATGARDASDATDGDEDGEGGARFEVRTDGGANDG